MILSKNTHNNPEKKFLKAPDEYTEDPEMGDWRKWTTHNIWDTGVKKVKRGIVKIVHTLSSGELDFFIIRITGKNNEVLSVLFPIKCLSIITSFLRVLMPHVSVLDDFVSGFSLRHFKPYCVF